jgi:hypothetical protein
MDGGLGTRLGAVDFAAVADACGALGLTVQTDDEFEPALRQAMEAGRPALLHLALDPRWTTVEAGLAEVEAGVEPEPELAPAAELEVERSLSPEPVRDPERTPEPEPEPVLDPEPEPVLAVDVMPAAESAEAVSLE